ncbi:MAG: recombinase family protein [Candidatus Metalachnospira sp.]|nr:recombinase family protein [Candidatus Metalachnospira sp.]
MKSQIITTPGVQVLHRKTEQENRKIPLIRVAAYCRVSTDKESQQSSLETQITSFQEKITLHPGWELAGVYADEGLSGTSTERRVEFQRMISDCEAGKIDYIITKSISRFARNTIDCLKYVRQLKDKGVYIIFDENNIDTASSSSEMLLSILAAVAQEESRSISENLKWSVRKRFAAGIPKWSPTYGYINEDGEYLINEEQAVGVRRIFELYTSGKTLLEIVQILTDEEIPTMQGTNWWPKSLTEVLRNEKYVGDVLMQKSYTVDHLTHRKVKNDMTKVPSYRVTNHHNAIIDRKTFELAQTILAMRNRRNGCMQYPYYGTLICPICSSPMICFRLNTKGYPKVWTCGGEREGVLETDKFSFEKESDKAEVIETSCPHYAIKETYIDRAVIEAFKGLDREELQIRAVKNSAPGRAAKAALDWQMKELTQVEYIFLDALVKSITFRMTSDKIRWNEIIVIWKFGMKSRVTIKYEKLADLPFMEDDKHRFRSKVNADRHKRVIESGCEAVRGKDGRPRRIEVKKNI